MTLATLKVALTGHQLYLDDFNADAPSAAQQLLALNWALRNIGKRLHLFDPKITFTLVANQNEYNLRDVTTPVVSRKVLIPHAVYIGGNPLYQYNGNIGVWGIGQLARDRTTYLTAAAGTPEIAAFYQGKLWLHPKPDAIGSNNFISGTYIPADMAADGDVPGIPEELHECLAYYAAVHQALPTATEQEQWQRIVAYNAEWENEVARLAKEASNALEGPWDDAGWAYPRGVRI